MSVTAAPIGQKPGVWGKLSHNETGELTGWLPLSHHCLDVAMVFLELARQPAIRRSLDAALGRPATEADLERLAVIVFFHDVGKTNTGFQRKWDPAERQVAGHVKELLALFGNEDLQGRFLEAVGYQDMMGWCTEDDGALQLLLASISHHGSPFVLDTALASNYAHWWKPSGDLCPMAAIRDMSRQARETFPLAFDSSADPMTASAELQHALAGLVMLADWLGSDTQFFPYNHGPGDRPCFSRKAAARAVSSIGIDASHLRSVTSLDQAFSDIFPFPPTPLQEALFGGNDASTVIAESDTGSGKTEAALGHYYRLWSQGLVDSLYFALPTRVAAQELYERLRVFAQAVFGDKAPPVVLAVPGYAKVDGKSPYQFTSPSHLWHDEADAHARERTWSAEHPKRFLAAPIAVGTIDQALLSVLRVKHSHLRAACLDRSLIVVDEVHASDTYMRGLLRALLDRHRQAGGRALLLSATLGSAMREELLSPPGRRSSPPPLEEAIALPYPSITDSNGGLISLAGATRRPKRVSLDPRPWLLSPEKMIPEIEEAISRGARVLVVMNTVGRVLSLLRAAEAVPLLSQSLFRVKGEICPHHGRFARADRLLLDAAVTQKLGKGSPGGPALMIGSQTLEQSLDIDADWLITDLCPVDVLLQRIGRLHRHDRERPRGFESPRCTLLAPEDSSMSEFIDSQGRPRPQGTGLGNVYPDLRIARLTLQLAEQNPEIDIPEQNRELVEMATHPDRLNGFEDDRWLGHRSKLMAATLYESQMAHRSLVDRALSFGDPDLAFARVDDVLATRLGLENRTIAFDPPIASPFGQRLTEMSIPGWMAQGLRAEAPDFPPLAEGGIISFSMEGRAFQYSRLGLEAL